VSTTPVLPSRLDRILYGIARSLVVGICRVLWRPKVLGRERLPQGAYVLAPSHRSFLDTHFMACATRRRIRFMGKAELWKYGWSARLLSALGGFPVNRGIPDRTSLHAALDALAGGEPVVVFPEGTRRKGPFIEDLHDGAAYLAARAGVPVVPVGIGGSEEILAKGRKVPKLKKVVLVVGDPLEPPRREGPVRRSDVAALTDRLRKEVQDLFDQAQALAESS
jgi:1-acyl-sn-glycerol-3-phosphate acyltransferase